VLGDAPALAYLRNDRFDEAASFPLQGRFAIKLAAFLASYGHRCSGEGELRNARWGEDIAPLLRAVVASADTGAALPAAADGSTAMAALLAAVDSKQRKEVQALVQQIRQWLPLQSRALDAYAYVLAGTRRWAQAAAHEAMSDHRLLSPDDVFFYELEEMKEMMTGEWNVSDRSGIRATAAERKTNWEGFAHIVPGELLICTQEAAAAAPGLPGAAGQARGATAFTLSAAGKPGAKFVLVAMQPDAGWASALPAAAGFVVAQGSALDPVLAAAATLRVPAVYGLGTTWTQVTDGQIISLDGDAGKVTIGEQPV
jgi:rifampicin phosphotransferase